MFTNRRRIWAAGLTIGVLITAFFIFGPRKSAEQRIAEDVAILAREPWHPIHVQQVDFSGSRQDRRDVFVYGARPDGTPVVVQFADNCPYTSSTAMRRLAEQPLAGRTVEFLLMPRSMVNRAWKDRFEANVTHAGIALFAGLRAAEDSDPTEETPPVETEDGASQETGQQDLTRHGNG